MSQPSFFILIFLSSKSTSSVNLIDLLIVFACMLIRNLNNVQPAFWIQDFWQKKKFKFPLLAQFSSPLHHITSSKTNPLPPSQLIFPLNHHS